MEAKIKYVYCIIDCSVRKSFGQIGIGGSEVYTVPYRDICAVVSDLPMSGGSALNPIEVVEPSEGIYLRHEEVVSKVMLEHTVLPVKFLSLLKNDPDLVRMLRLLYRDCKAELKKFENKVEVGVKVLLEGMDIKREIEERGREITKLREDLARTVKLMLKSKVDLLDDATKRVLDGVEEGGVVDPDEYAVKIYYSREFCEKLRGCAIDARMNQLLGRDMILNGSFLISRSRVEEFQESLEEIRRRYEGRGFKFLFSGPWAPYNFTEIKYH